MSYACEYPKWYSVFEYPDLIDDDEEEQNDPDPGDVNDNKA